jgi:hypothetical protein
MIEFFAAALQLPTLIWTVLLGFVGVYWVAVMVGGLDIDALDGAADGALEGASHAALDGAADAAFDGAADAAAHAALDGAADAALEAGSHGVVDTVAQAAADHVGEAMVEAAAQGAGEHGAEGAMDSVGETAGMLASLKLRSVPATLLITILVFLNFLLCHGLNHYVGGGLAAVMPEFVSGALIFLGSFVTSVPIASLAIRPLAPMFKVQQAKTRGELVGKVVEISTGRVDTSFGQATHEDGQAGLIVDIRADPALGLSRGDKALVIAHDDAGEFYEVARLDDILPSEAGSD